MFKLKNIEIRYKIGDSEQEKICSSSSFIIGRSVKSDVQIDSKNVSRNHLKVMYKDGVILIEDLNSTNGTYLNGEKLRQGQVKAYESTDKLAFGLKEDVILRMVAQQVEEEDEAPQDKREQKIQEYNEQIKNEPEQAPLQSSAVEVESSQGADDLLAQIEKEKRALENQTPDSNYSAPVPQVSEASGPPKVGGSSSPQVIQSNAPDSNIENELKGLSLEKSTLQEDVQNLKQEKQSLQSELKTKDDEILASEEKLKNLHSKIKEIETQSSSAIQESEEKGKIIRELAGEANKLRETLSEINKNIRLETENLEKIKAEKESTVSSLAQNKTVLEEEIANIEKQKAESAETLKAKQAEVDHFNQNIVNLSQQLESLNQNSENLTKDLKQKEEKIQTQNAKFNDLVQESDKLTNEINSKHDELKKTQEEIVFKNSEVAKIEANIQELKTNQEKLVSENESTQLEIEAAHKRLDEVNLNLEQLLKDKTEQEAANQKLIEDANQEKENILQAAAEEKDRIYQEAQDAKAQTLQDAENEKLRIIDEAQAESKNIISKAEQESQEIISQADSSANQKITEAHSEVQQLLDKAQQDSSKIINSAQNKAQDIIDESKEDAANRISEAQEKSQNIIAKGKSEAERYKEEQEKESQDLLTITQSQCHEMKEKATKEAEEVNLRATKEAEKTLQDAKQEAQETKLSAVRYADEQKKTFEMTEKRRLQANSEKLKKELELVLVTKMKPFLNKQEPEALSNIEGILKGTVGSILTGEMFDEGDLLETMLEAKTLNQQKRVKKFWKVASVSVVAGTFMAFFGVPFMVDQFKEKSRDVAAIIKKEDTEKIEARKNETKEALYEFFEPQKSTAFRDNYTDLVLYTEGYVDKVLDPDYREQWIIDLQTFFTDELELSENNLVPFIAMEANMIRELHEESKKINGKFIEEGIARMRGTEDKFKKRLMLELSSEEDFNKVMKFQEKFYNSH